MSVTIPREVHDRINAGLYPPCTRCRGEGVIYPPNPHRTLAEPAAYLEEACTSCVDGYVVPFGDLHLHPTYPMHRS